MMINCLSCAEGQLQLSGSRLFSKLLYFAKPTAVSDLAMGSSAGHIQGGWAIMFQQVILHSSAQFSVTWQAVLGRKHAAGYIYMSAALNVAMTWWHALVVFGMPQHHHSNIASS